MTTEQLTWFIDSRFYYHPSSLDKVVHLADFHGKKITVIIDASAQLTGRGYWHLFEEANTLSNELMSELEKKQAQLLKFFSMNAIKSDVIINQSANYLTELKKHTISNSRSLVVIENTDVAKRHSIFQKLAELNTPILLLNKKPWKSNINLLAAIDPLHEHASSGTIDDNIVSFTQQWALMLKGSCIISHCYFVASVLTKYKNKVFSMHQEGLAQFAKKRRLPPEQCVLLEGVPEDALTAYAHKHHTDILVLGLVARNKITQLWIGSTTTALLSELPCDLLMINK